MIKYILKCKSKHEFESWFSSSKEYEKLIKKNLIECIFCKSTKIDKSIMSPSVIRKKNKSENKKFIKTRKNFKKLKQFIEKNYEFVGDKFSTEVREIYYNNKKNKNIYGTVSPEEREDLEEEGINLATIPWTRDKDN
tara:strand:+ start:459 stop:869 length:411 start_codon:yes stop_codon:yes gene_type:complete